MNEIIDNSSYGSNDLNQRVFINTNNPKVKSQTQKKNDPFPSIKLSFPPSIDPKDLLIIGKDNKPTRSPNAFIIYRKVFFKTVRNEGHLLPMTTISSMASRSWEREPDEIKKYYKRLAKEAYNYRIECFPKKINKRKKREKWNIISFKNSDSSSSNDNNILENVNDNLLNMQLPVPTEDILKNSLTDALIQNNSSSLQEHITSNEFFLDIFNNDIVQNDVQINNTSINHFSEDNISELLNLQQQIYTNPNLSSSDESNVNGLQQQQFSFSEEITIDNNNNDLTDSNSFDNLNAFLQPNFSDFLDNLNNDDATAESFTDLTQREDDFGNYFC